MCHEYSDCDATTLGLNTDNDIICDLRLGCQPLSEYYNIVIHAAGSNDEKCAMDVNYNGTINLCKALENRPPKQFVFISSASVYGVITGENITESAPLRPTSQYGQSKLKAEMYLQQWCIEHNVTLSILRPPMILGTGMKGTLRAMVNGINNGYYYNIKGNDAQRSIIHALDVALITRLIAPHGGTYNISDQCNPKVTELGNALAHRINGKRLYTLPRWIVKMVLPAKQFAQLTTTFTLNCDAIASKIQYQNIDVINYLRTHIYDENDI